jgi:hypothetical protein
MGTSAIWQRWTTRRHRVFFSIGVGLLAAWGVMVNTVQGMFMPAAISWNGTIDHHPNHYLWEWRYPQFLAAFQPADIMTYRSNYRLRLQAQLKDVPAGSQLYCAGGTSDFPMLRKVCRDFSRDKSLGDVFLFPDYHLRLLDRPMYATPFGKLQVEKDHPELKAIPVRPYPDLGSVLARHGEQVTYLLANSLTPTSLSPASCAFLSRAGVEIPCGAERLGLLVKLHQGKAVWYVWSDKEELRRWEYIGDQQVIMVVEPSNPHQNPYFQMGKQVLTDYAASAFVIAIDPATHQARSTGMELNHTDIFAGATFRIEPR